MIESKEQYYALTKHIRHRMAPDYQDQLWELIEALREVARAAKRAEKDVRLNLNPMLEKLGMHPFTLMEKDLAKVLGALPDWILE